MLMCLITSDFDYITGGIMALHPALSKRMRCLLRLSAGFITTVKPNGRDPLLKQRVVSTLKLTPSHSRVYVGQWDR